MITSPIREFGRLLRVNVVEMSRNFLIWSEDITSQANKSAMATGTGSPEGVIDAPVGKLYTDTSAGAGGLLYVKRDADIAGDTTKGWFLV
jgi:hypothetical protein